MLEPTRNGLAIVDHCEPCSRPPYYRWPIWQPLLAALLFSLLVRTFDWDRKISALFYDTKSHTWPLQFVEPFLTFYRFGIYPPVVVGIAGGVFAVFGHQLWPRTEQARMNHLRRGGLFLALLLILGPGLVVEVGFKSFWGRPRPKECHEFGGEQTFRPVGEWTYQSKPNSSFPSGHAANAFFLMAPCFLFGSDRRRQSICWFVAGIGYGTAMCVTRVFQGDHFLSDVVWSGFFVYIVGAVLARVMIQTE